MVNVGGQIPKQNYILRQKVYSQNRISKRSFKQRLATEYNTYWAINIQSEPKMRTYIKFKHNFSLEDYLLFHLNTVKLHKI